MYFADAATASGKVFGNLLAMVLIYFVIYGIIRLVTKKSPTKQQKIIAAIVAVVLALASIARQNG